MIGVNDTGDPPQREEGIMRQMLVGLLLLTCVTAGASTARGRLTGQSTPREGAMTALPLRIEIGAGPDKQVNALFDGPRRKLVQITLRNGAVLAEHKAPVPITIHCVAGKGTLTVGPDRQAVALSPGVLVTLEPDVLHEISASPAVSILLTQFTGA
jgi:quercetin dioxygenase-like cupin family protein